MRDKHTSVAVASKEMIKAEMKRRHRKSQKQAKRKEKMDRQTKIKSAASIGGAPWEAEGTTAPTGPSTDTDDSDASEAESESASLLGRDLSAHLQPSPALRSQIKNVGSRGFGYNDFDINLVVVVVAVGGVVCGVVGGVWWVVGGGGPLGTMTSTSILPTFLHSLPPSPSPWYRAGLSTARCSVLRADLSTFGVVVSTLGL